MNKFLTSRIVAVLCLALFSFQSFAGTITGNVQNAQSGPVANGIFSFTLNAPATLAGTATIATMSVNCYTDANGAIVNEPNPLIGPILSTNLGSGTLAAGTYFVRITYRDATGESFPSPELSINLAAPGTLIVTPPVKQPAGATSYRVYIGTASGNETLQGTVTVSPGSWGSYSQSAALAAGAALPVSNTTVCTVIFNDQLTPSFTCYDVGLTSSTGANIPGFPQWWYVAGGSAGTVNISSGTPQSNVCQGSGIVYPQAVLTLPPFNATQTVNGGLNLNGFPLTAGNGTFSGLVSAYTSAGELIGKFSTISAAYAALPSGNGNIVASCGTYNENLTITTSVTIGGVDKTCVIIKPLVTASPVFKEDATSQTFIDGVNFHDFSLQCPAATACGDGFLITGSQTTNQVNDHIKIENVNIGNLFVVNTTGTSGFNNSINITGRTIYSTLRNVTAWGARNNHLRVVLPAGGLVGPVNDLSVENSQFDGAYGSGVVFDCNGSVTPCAGDLLHNVEVSSNGGNTALTPCDGISLSGVWTFLLNDVYYEGNCLNNVGDANSAHLRITGSVATPQQVTILNGTSVHTAAGVKYSLFDDAARSALTVEGLKFIGTIPTHAIHIANTSPDSLNVINNIQNADKLDIVTDANGNTHTSIPAIGLQQKVVINTAQCPITANAFDLITGCTGNGFPMADLSVNGPVTLNNITSGLVNHPLRICSEAGGGVVTLGSASGGAGQMNFAAASAKLLQINECVILRRLAASDAWQEVAIDAPKVLAVPGTAAAPSITSPQDPTTGLQFDFGSGTMGVSASGTDTVLWASSLQRNRSSLVLGWAAGTPTAGGSDTCLSRSAAGVLQVGSGSCETANSNGSIKPAAVVSGGAAATLTGTGACATFSTQTGGSMAGRATCTGVTAASTLTITPGTTAPNGWVCYVQDQTTRANLFQQTSNTTGGCTLTVTSVTQNDVFVFTAIAF